MAEKISRPIPETVQQLVINEKLNEITITGLKVEMAEIKKLVTGQKQQLKEYIDNKVQASELKLLLELQEIKAANKGYYEAISNTVSVLLQKINGVDGRENNETMLTNLTRSSTPILESSSINVPKPERQNIIPQATSLTNIKHLIIIPPASAAPSFSGKHTESPTQFLRDSALEWC